MRSNSFITRRRRDALDDDAPQGLSRHLGLHPCERHLLDVAAHPLRRGLGEVLKNLNHIRPPQQLLRALHNNARLQQAAGLLENPARDFAYLVEQQLVTQIKQDFSTVSICS